MVLQYNSIQLGFWVFRYRTSKQAANTVFVWYATLKHCPVNLVVERLFSFLKL